MSNKMDKLLKQVNEAAGEVVGLIHEADAKIAALQRERQQIGAAPVSKADFLAYISQAIDKKSAVFAQGQSLKIGQIDTSFFSLDSGGLQYFNFLLAYNAGPVDIQEGGLYWYLKPAIMARMAEVAERMDLPEEAMSIEDRRTRIGQIDAELSALRIQRNEMVSQLQKAGLIG